MDCAEKIFFIYCDSRIDLFSTTRLASGLVSGVVESDWVDASRSLAIVRGHAPTSLLRISSLSAVVGTLWTAITSPKTHQSVSKLVQADICKLG